MDKVLSLSNFTNGLMEYGVALLDGNGKILTWNKGASLISGLSKTEVLNRNFQIVFGSDSENEGLAEELINKLNELNAGEYRSEQWHYRNNGEKYWATSTLTSVAGEDGYLLIFRDITRKKELLDEATKNEHQLKIAQRIAKVGSFAWNPQTNEATWSEEMFQILGLSKEKHSGSAGDIYEFIHPDDVQHVQDATAKAIETKQGVPVEYRIITTDGELKHIFADGSGVYDDLGNMVMMYGTIQDITERRLLQEQVDSFFKFSLELHCIATPFGQFLRVNPAWEELLGYSEKELLGISFFDLIHPDDLEATKLEAKRLQEIDYHTISFVNRYKVKTGGYKWLEWTSGVVPTTGLLMATARDISSKIEREEKLKSRTKELEIKNKELAQFAYVSSHDLQEPLKTVKSFTNLLKTDLSEGLSEEAKTSINFIQNAVGRMEKLVGGLLDYSRIGTMESLEEVDLEQLVNNILQDLHVQISDQGAVFKVDNLPTLKADPLALRLIFQNLISNALKFVAAGRKPLIAINAERDGKFYKFSVSDNGIGIAPRFHEKIFLIFQRLHSRKEFSGTGIGLAHVKKAVGLAGGEIWLESKIDKGSTFYFTWPA